MVLSAGVPTIWRQAVKRATWTSYERVFRSSALELADAADTQGTICRPRDVLAQRLGLPVRTFDYHLRWLIERGWLERGPRALNRGSVRRPTVYRLTFPDRFDSQPVANGKAVSTRKSQRMETPLSTRNMVANVNRDRASVSEHVAVDEHAPDKTTTAAPATTPPNTAGSTASNNEKAA